MQAKPLTAETGHLRVLLRGEPASLRAWTEAQGVGRIVLCLGVIWIGAGLYGAAMGLWRAPLQAFYVAIKFPLIVLLTTFGNALLNAMLAPLLGLNIPFRQSFLAILMSFAIASAILGAFSPITLFITWNTPPLTADVSQSWGTYSFIQLTHVAAIAFAGTVGNLRLVQLLRELGGGDIAKARRVLVAWLAVNFFLGSQLSWILRPFIGAPTLPVQFFRADAFHGNFYEAVFSSIARMLGLK